MRLYIAADKLSKQPDVLMLFYLFSADELRALFPRLDYPFDAQTILRNINYYSPGAPTTRPLSRVAESWVLPGRTARGRGTSSGKRW